ncbi:MAG: (Fe-S)-binding protein [Desulfurivibrionaceae bacterium]|nr:(Fe-S)-binding protein [Desulfurivibrionaceae bacterium]
MAGQPEIKASTCAKCGACTPVCPVFQSTGRESHTARGKLHLFKAGASFDSAYFNDLLAKCLQCGACDAACPRNLRPSEDIRAWRARQPFGRDPHGFAKFLTKKVLATPLLQEGGSKALAALLATLPKASGLRKRLDLLAPTLAAPSPLPALPKKESPRMLAYFPGCLAQHLYKEITKATAIMAGHCGFELHTPAALTCCGLASHVSGSEQEAKTAARRNIKAFAEGTAGPILTSCASCTSHLKSYPTLFTDDPEMHGKATAFASRIQEFSTFFLAQEELSTSRPAETLYYHDPCHLRFGPCQVTKEPRQLLTQLNGAPPLSLPAQCCGQGGLFHLTNPDISRDIFSRALAPLAELSQGLVVTTCSGCLLQWQQGLARAKSPLRAEHLAVFLAKIIRD